MRFDVSSIIMWVLVGGAVVAVIAVGFTFLRRGRRAARIQSVLSKRRGELSKKQKEELAKPSAIRQSQQGGYVELLQKVLSGLKLQNYLSSKGIRDSLMQAGFRGRSTVIVYVASRAMGIVAGFLVTLFVVNMWQNFPYPAFLKLVIVGAGGVAGFYLPKVFLVNLAQKRQKEMSQTFPDVLDLMVICVEAGLGVDSAFARVTEEIMDSSPILAQELGLTSAELTYLSDRRQAYENFVSRTGMPAVKSLATALIQSEKYGTPVGVALKVLSQEKRDERMSMAEKKAAALPAKLSVPMIIFFLPLLFSVVIGPAFIQINM